jgi:radical SAM protein with 4Fe4S-binding SPASM domain
LVESNRCSLTPCLDIPEVEAEDFWRPIRSRAYRERIPLQGSFELTFRCNLRCVHCYITQADSLGKLPSGVQELSTAEVCGIIDQIVAEGCLFLLLTGGEPLLRSDFVEIYTYAKRKGLLLYLYTNGTLLTPELADFLGEWRPRHVEISLYGCTRETYERVTGVSGSYERCRRGIDLLVERGVPLHLKTMALTLNKHELPGMRAFAEDLGLDFRFDAEVHACVDGSRRPWNYRLSPEEVVELDMADPRRAKSWRELYERVPHDGHVSEALYACGAGLASFHIDACGQLTPCMSVRQSTYDIRRGSFGEGWRTYLKRVRCQEMPRDYRCARCAARAFCTSCPGRSFLETGDQRTPSNHACEVAHLRAYFLGEGSLHSNELKLKE